MSVELLERPEKEASSNNSYDAGLSYNDVCIRDSQNMDAETRNVVYEHTVDSQFSNNYEKESPHYRFGNRGDNENAHENFLPVERKRNLLDQYLHEKRLPLDLRLFRGTSLEWFCKKIEFRDIDKEIFLNDCITIADGDRLTQKYTGQIFTYKQSVPTSVEIEIACDFLNGPTQCMLTINAPRGTFGRCIRNISEYPRENEVLLPSDTQFRIVEIRPHEKVKDIYVDVVVDSQARNSYDIGNTYL